MTTNAGTGHGPAVSRLLTPIVVELTAATAVIPLLDRYGNPGGLARSAVGSVASLLSGGRMQARG
jgi:hypothetical protein